VKELRREIPFLGELSWLVTAHPKDGLYCDQDLGDTFLFFVVKVFDCLHQQLDAFLHQCAYMTWSTKGMNDCPLSILWTFYKQRVVARPFLGLASFPSHCPIWFMRLLSGLRPRLEIWTWTVAFSSLSFWGCCLGFGCCPLLFLPFPFGLMLFQWFYCFIQVKGWRMEMVVSWWYAWWWMLSTWQWQWWCKERRREMAF